MFVFRNIWRALFSWNTRFEIGTFALLLRRCYFIKTRLPSSFLPGVFWLGFAESIFWKYFSNCKTIFPNRFSFAVAAVSRRKKKWYNQCWKITYRQAMEKHVQKKLAWHTELLKWTPPNHIRTPHPAIFPNYYPTFSTLKCSSWSVIFGFQPDLTKVINSLPVLVQIHFFKKW